MNQENLENIHSWLQSDMYGEPGSPKRKAHELKLALGCIASHETIHSVHERKALRRNYNDPLIKILKAFKENDAEFFSTVADGLKQLREKEEFLLTPLHCPAWTYMFMTSRKDTADSSEKVPVPTKAELIAEAKRTWAICRLTGEVTPIYIIYNEGPGFEAKIEREMQKLPKQDWTQHFKDLGIVLPNATPGPKRGSKRRIRITRR
jgi:hypothetical protein